MKPAYTQARRSKTNCVRVPLERQKLPDPFQIAATELCHIIPSLLLVAAQDTERLGVEVLQQSQLQSANRYLDAHTHTCNRFSVNERYSI